MIKQVNCTGKNIRQVVLQSWIVQTWGPALYFRKTTKCTYTVTGKCFWKKMQHFRVTYRNRNNGFMFVNVTSNNNVKFSWNGFFIQFNNFRSGIHISRSNERLSSYGRLHLKRRAIPCQLIPETSLIHYSPV